MKSILMCLLLAQLIYSKELNGQSVINYSFSRDFKNTNALFLYDAGNREGLDTIFYSDLPECAFNFTPKYGQPNILWLFINGNAQAYRTFMVDKDTVNFRISKSKYEGYYNLDFEMDPNNQRFQLRTEELLPLKAKSDSLLKLTYDPSLNDKELSEIGATISQIRDSINKCWADFYTKYSNSYFALGFIANNLRPLSLERNFLIKIFNGLDSSYSRYKLYNTVKRELFDTAHQIVVGSDLPDIVVRDKYGYSQKLQSLVNKQDTYIVFWASWCYGCLEEFKEIKKHPEIYNSNFQLLFVSFDKSREAWLTDTTKHDFLSGSYWLPDGIEDINIYRLGINSIPYIIGVDSTGKIEEMDVKIKKLFNSK